MKDKLLWGTIFIVTFYMVFPFIFMRIMGIGVFMKGRLRGKVAFTFDDGPDPAYTPKLLDMLNRHHVQATFFVLGSKAERYPELIRRMHDEGHQIGIHNYRHTANWIMWPWTVKRKQVDRTAAIIEGITGVRPAYYRPPWGIVNLFDFLIRRHYRIVLWSLMVRDWRSDIGHEQLKQRLLEGLSDGEVVLLHDSGDTLGADSDAPEQMLMALEEVLAEADRRGLSGIRIDRMIEESAAISPAMLLSLTKRSIIAVWMLWEKLFIRLLHIEPVDRSNPLLRLRVREYQGSMPIMLDDGECIRKGDLVAELHLDNDRLFRLGALSRNTTQLAIQLIRGMEQLLPRVTERFQNDPTFRNVKGLYGISLINRGPQQLGFTVVDLPKGFFARITTWYLRILLSVIHPQGKKRLSTKSEMLVPKIVAMSKKQLVERYIA
jgi:peptidoglycan/xylan/chitin deacetylase (PgdA/CDA1 family)